jgi:hypothetical protein
MTDAKKLWIQNNRERLRENSRKFYQEHKEAEKARSKAWRLANPEKYQAWAEKNREKRKIASRKHDHGMLPDNFNRLWQEQEGLCAICHQPLVRPDIDHDHSCCQGRKSCGKCNRGLLCRPCNTFIGLAKESLEILKNAIQYLEKWNVKHS